ncbi:hypothetical protein [Aerococcus sp. UMB7834]|uniref:hypothetical protein n=1 Tax=Aerococcus sp. UMB7834 TaxID=3046342 RepID=UPI00254B6BA3|nr:hypothetical protein [Aerococcus sp. UMB7834]MDK6804241.1 hypothetical protein [Aerococcus sp. UMB7834]
MKKAILGGALALVAIFGFVYALLTYTNHVYLERYKAGNDAYSLQAHHYEKVTGEEIIQADEVYSK